MKKVFVLFGALAFMLGTSCNEKKTGTDTVDETETTVPNSANDTIEADGDVNASDARASQTEETDGTSVSINSDGASVNTNDGTNKTNVEVKEGSGSVEVRR